MLLLLLLFLRSAKWHCNVMGVCVCNMTTFESRDLESHLQSAGTSSQYTGQVVYEGHRVRVKVTGMKCDPVTSGLRKVQAPLHPA